MFSCDREHNKADSYSNNKEYIISDTKKEPLKQRVSYYENGKIREICNYLDDTINSDCYLYNEKGELYFSGSYHNGKLEGKGCFFYDSGRIWSVNNYCNGLMLGMQYEYDSLNPSSVTNRLYVPFQGKSIFVGKKHFLEGKLIYDSSRVITSVLSKNIRVGDSVLILVFKYKPNFDMYRLHVRNYNDCFELRDTIDNIISEGSGNVCTFKVKAEKRGVNTLRGLMEDYKIEKMNKDGSHTTLGSLNNFFEVEYLVQ